MSTCSVCGGTRVENILRHKQTCPSYRDTFRAVVNQDAAVDRIRLHPCLAQLEADLRQWYPTEEIA